MTEERATKGLIGATVTVVLFVIAHTITFVAHYNRLSEGFERTEAHQTERYKELDSQIKSMQSQLYQLTQNYYTTAQALRDQQTVKHEIDKIETRIHRIESSIFQK